MIRVSWHREHADAVSRPADGIARDWCDAMDAVACSERVTRNERGESITEVLVALLIGGLAVLMMATAIASSVNIVRNGNKAMNDYYSFTNQVAEGAGTGASGTIVVQETMNGTGEDGSGASENASVVFYQWKEGDSDARMVSYKKSASDGGGT